MRIAKYIAKAGVCSRREAERLIEQGHVNLNGSLVTTPALNISERDEVQVKGISLTAPSAPRLWCYHKPAGLVTTHKDEQNRPTVFENLPKDLTQDVGHIISIGRLDLNTEGLLLLTNDGDLARFLELPDNGFERRYRVRARGTTTQKKLDDLAKGLKIDGVRYRPIQAQLEKPDVTAQNFWLSVALHEGKNREIRKVMTHLGLQVSRLIRTHYGPFQLGNLERGMVQEISQKKIKGLNNGRQKTEGSSD